MIDDRSRPRPCQPCDVPVIPAGAHRVAVLHRAANLDPRLRGDDGGGGVRRRAGTVSDMTAGMIDDRSRPRPCQPCDVPVLPAGARHVAVLHRAANLDPRLRGDDGGGGVRRRAGAVSDMTAGFCGNDRTCPSPRHGRHRRRSCPYRPTATATAVVHHRRRPPPHRPTTTAAVRLHRRPCPHKRNTVIPAKAGIQVGLHRNDR